MTASGCLVAQGNTIESEHLSELTEEEYEAHYIRRQDLKGFLWLDAKYLNPFFTRRLTQEVGPGPCHGATRPFPCLGHAVAKGGSRVGARGCVGLGCRWFVGLHTCCLAALLSSCAVIDWLTVGFRGCLRQLLTIRLSGVPALPLFSTTHRRALLQLAGQC